MPLFFFSTTALRRQPSSRAEFTQPAFQSPAPTSFVFFVPFSLLTLSQVKRKGVPPCLALGAVRGGGSPPPRHTYEQRRRADTTHKALPRCALFVANHGRLLLHVCARQLELELVCVGGRRGTDLHSTAAPAPLPPPPPPIGSALADCTACPPNPTVASPFYAPARPSVSRTCTATTPTLTHTHTRASLPDNAVPPVTSTPSPSHLRLSSATPLFLLLLATSLSAPHPPHCAHAHAHAHA